MAVSYTPGFNDIFREKAAQSNQNSDLTFSQAKSFNARTLRFNLYWPRIEVARGNYDWSSTYALIGYARLHGFKLLPVVLDTPTEWISGQDRQLTGLGVSYPLEDAWSDYGNFVANALAWFDAWDVIQAIEIWNEPNFAQGPFMPALNLAGMINASVAAKDAKSYSRPMTVVSGGLIMEGTGWHGYMSDFLYQTQCFPHAVGIHPYDMYDYDASGASMAAAVFSLTTRIAQKFDDAAGRTSLDLWVTETGCGSGPPFGLQGQSLAFSNLFAAGGVFATRPRCKAALVHRLLNIAQPGFETYPVLYSDLTAKQPAQQTLSQAWTGAP